VTPPPGSGGYAFLSRTDTGAPVAYDPCRPITYVVRPQGAPPDGDRAIREAIAAVSTATGLAFVDGGRTDEAPSDKRPAYQPDRYGQRWAPLLIAWSTPAESPVLAGATAGYGGSTAETLTAGDSVQSAYVSGSVVLDGPQLRDVARRQGPDEVRAIVEHELGHVVGLDHVPDRHQLMYPENNPGITAYGTGDLRGLARLGSGPCTPGL
jgi:hypothetical protein